jgi:hypothetical protein
MAVQFKKATRQAVQLKVLVTGPSGSGKTLGALKVASSIAPGRVAVVDSEKDRASYYADQVEFDALSLETHTPAAYMEAIGAAVDAGYQVVIVDSLSHAWQNVLDRKEQYDRANPRSNGYTNWKIFGAEWEKLIRYVLEAPIHVLCTARSKQAYELVQGENGKKAPEKLGLAPQLREGTEYEFAIVLDLLPSHKARASKDNTGRLDRGEGVLWDLCDGSLGRELSDWLSSAAPATPRAPRRNPEAATDEQIARLRFLITDERLSEDVVAKVESALKRGLLESKADLWIRQIEQQLAAHRPEAPRVEITGSTADPALVEHFASQPDPYTGEAGELPLNDAKQAPRAPSPQSQGE